MIPTEWILQAQQRIQPYIVNTPLAYDSGSHLYIKWENRQITGSFKIRGALNKVLSLQPWERERGLVAASAGNHGSGLALAGKMTGAPVIVFVPERASPLKIQRMEEMHAKVVRVPGGYGEAEQAGLDFAQKNDLTWVSPYNDGQIIAGQATLGMEVASHLPPGSTYTWAVPCGGGGLLSGIGAVLRSLSGTESVHRLVGVQSEASPFMHSIYHRHSQDGVLDAPSLADGLSGPVESNSITIPIVRSTTDDFILVSEAEIVAAIRFAWEQYGEIIEPSAATAFAAFLSGRLGSGPSVLVMSGGNIHPEIHQKLIGQG